MILEGLMEIWCIIILLITHRYHDPSLWPIRSDFDSSPDHKNISSTYFY